MSMKQLSLLKLTFHYKLKIKYPEIWISANLWMKTWQKLYRYHQT